jgi:hypothetical protein
VLMRAAHDPPKCERFGDKIMRFLNKRRARSGAKPVSTFADRALACAAPLEVLAVHWVLIEPVAGSIVHDMF